VSSIAGKAERRRRWGETPPAANDGPPRGFGRVARTSSGGFRWRGIEFSRPVGAEPSAFYSSEPIVLSEDRAGEWRVQQVNGGAWHARLRIGGDRFPGVGETAAAALDAAAAEASSVATYIIALLPRPWTLGSPAPASKRPRSAARKGAR
jgi:hypothetical protein